MVQEHHSNLLIQMTTGTWTVISSASLLWLLLASMLWLSISFHALGYFSGWNQILPRGDWRYAAGPPHSSNCKTFPLILLLMPGGCQHRKHLRWILDTGQWSYIIEHIICCDICNDFSKIIYMIIYHQELDLFILHCFISVTFVTVYTDMTNIICYLFATLL